MQKVVGVVGDFGTGKTELCREWCNVTEGEHDITRSPQRFILSKQLTIVDYPAYEQDVTSCTHLVIVLNASTALNTRQNLSLLEHYLAVGKPCLICLNQADVLPRLISYKGVEDYTLKVKKLMMMRAPVGGLLFTVPEHIWFTSCKEEFQFDPVGIKHASDIMTWINKQ